MQQPHNTITSFFDCYSLSNARSTLSKMLKAAGSASIWNAGAPAHLLFFLDEMKKLMKAAFAITSFRHFREEVILQKNHNDAIWSLTQYHLYCGRNERYSAWHFFPRHLSQKEFLDPHKALQKFTRYQTLTKWKAIMRDLVQYALTPASINELDDEIRMLQLADRLHKLIEASHLIAIRMNDEPAKPNKLKWKNKKEENKQEEQNIDH